MAVDMRYSYRVFHPDLDEHTAVSAPETGEVSDVVPGDLADIARHQMARSGYSARELTAAAHPMGWAGGHVTVHDRHTGVEVYRCRYAVCEQAPLSASRQIPEQRIVLVLETQLGLRECVIALSGLLDDRDWPQLCAALRTASFDYAQQHAVSFNDAIRHVIIQLVHRLDERDAASDPDGLTQLPHQPAPAAFLTSELHRMTGKENEHD